MIKNPLRILILEDQSFDAELVQFELEEAGFVFTSKVVATEEDFLRELREFSPHLILSDYDLPQYTGALALVAVRNHCPEVPFILVTGAIDEERAIHIFRNGAMGFVMKNHLSNLAPVIRKVLGYSGQ